MVLSFWSAFFICNSISTARYTISLPFLSLLLTTRQCCQYHNSTLTMSQRPSLKLKFSSSAPKPEASSTPQSATTGTPKLKLKFGGSSFAPTPQVTPSDPASSFASTGSKTAAKPPVKPNPPPKSALSKPRTTKMGTLKSLDPPLALPSRRSSSTPAPPSLPS